MRASSVSLTPKASLFQPFAGGADQALVLHLSNGSQDPAFRADVAAKESNQDRALGLVLMAVRFGLLLWVGTDWHRAWVVVAVLSVGHIALNYMAARILVLKTLNYDRFDTAFDPSVIFHKTFERGFDPIVWLRCCRPC